MIGADFAEAMLHEGRGKLASGRISPVVADALSLPVPAGALDGAIVAFGIRNVADLDACLGEVHRAPAYRYSVTVNEYRSPRL